MNFVNSPTRRSPWQSVYIDVDISTHQKWSYNAWLLTILMWLLTIVVAYLSLAVSKK